MKKRIYVYMVLLGIPFFGVSQEEESLYARAGFKTGLNYTNITGDTKDTDARYRVHLGAVVEFPISQKFYIQAEVLYSAQGYTMDSGTDKEKISINYLTLPLITKFYIIDSFTIETGPQFGLLSTARDSSDDTNNEFFDDFKSFDFSWGVGVGYTLDSGLFFQARYNLGLTNINDSDILNATNKNAVAQLSVGYLFKTKNNRRQEQE